MARLVMTACLLLAIATTGDPPRDDAAREQPGPALAVRIVPSAYRERAGRSIGGRFHVVVTNVSKQPVRLWKEWCSWGYFNLSFVVTGEDGKTSVVKKHGRNWANNFPDWMIIPPGDHLVYEVTFDETVWEGAPARPPGRDLGQPLRVKMKAIYEVPADDHAREHGVWTGRVSSPEETYAMYR